MSGLITAWRITQARYANDPSTGGGAFSGEGARRYGGRWNNPGTPVTYTAGSRSLALLEIIVHTEATRLLDQYVLIPITFSEALVEKLDDRDVPIDWRTNPAPTSTKNVGDAWAQSLRSVVLQVPSVIIPAEPNFLINPLHPDFSQLAIGEPERLSIDDRLV